MYLFKRVCRFWFPERMIIGFRCAVSLVWCKETKRDPIWCHLINTRGISVNSELQYLARCYILPQVSAWVTAQRGPCWDLPDFILFSPSSLLSNWRLWWRFSGFEDKGPWLFRSPFRSQNRSLLSPWLSAWSSLPVSLSLAFFVPSHDIKIKLDHYLVTSVLC